MSDAPAFYQDVAGNGATVITVFDVASQRWTTTVVGGPIDGWSTTYREDDDPVVQHAKAIEQARKAKYAGDSDAGAATVAGGDQPSGETAV